MYEGLWTLSEREKEVLRLLLIGHDAKSVARLLELSVHTVNERLRDARRKLGVSSSREAARLLAEVEAGRPDLFGDKKIGPANLFVDKRIGVAGAAFLKHYAQPSQRQDVGLSFAWLAGGMLVMSLIIAAFVLSSAITGAGNTPAPSTAAPAIAQQPMDLMPIADVNGDGKVTADEYKVFSEQGWSVVSQGKDKVKLSDLDQMAQMAFLRITPNAEGFITRQMYIDAIPARFQMFDQNGDGTLNSDELNGRASQS